MKSKLKLAKGDYAPDFDLVDVNGDQVKLSNYDNGYVFINFMRYSGCPFCNLAIHRLTIESPTLKKNGCQIIAFMQSEKQNIVDNIYNRHSIKPPFPIIADPGELHYERYGVEISVSAAFQTITKIPHWLKSVRDDGYIDSRIEGNKFLVPAAFLVDCSTQKIVIAYYGSNYYDHATFTDIYQALTFKEL